MIRELLRVYPGATRVKDKNGMLPARLAFEKAGSDQMMEQLLAAFPGMHYEFRSTSGVRLIVVAIKGRLTVCVLRGRCGDGKR